MDVDSPNPFGYANIGADALEKGMENRGLVDERREQLQQTQEFTRKGRNINGDIVSTRLDRWYGPAQTHYLLSYEVKNDNDESKIRAPRAKPDSVCEFVMLELALKRCEV